MITVNSIQLPNMRCEICDSQGCHEVTVKYLKKSLFGYKISKERTNYLCHGCLKELKDEVDYCFV